MRDFDEQLVKVLQAYSLPLTTLELNEEQAVGFYYNLKLSLLNLMKHQLEFPAEQLTGWCSLYSRWQKLLQKREKDFH